MEEFFLEKILKQLCQEPYEGEWIEFKANKYNAQDIGEYLSALSNSACLLGKPRAYIVFGVENETHKIVGTTFDPYLEKAKGNQPLLLWLSVGLQPNIGFEHYVIRTEGKRVVLFEVMPAIDRPVKFYGTAYIRVGSSKTELVKHPEKERAIWQRKADWSAQTCPNADMDDLDAGAIEKARHEYKVKFPNKTLEVDVWDDITFLNKIGLAIRGSITYSAIILLGKPESAGLISPGVARISWILKDDQKQEKDYEHFDPPFITNVDCVLAKIRNLNLRQLPGGTLFPVEIRQYDPWVLREALHNCIAHQDYGLNGRINVVELTDRLLLTNAGSFLPGNVEQVIQQDAPPEMYRNPALTKAMVNLNMIDTQGGGIKKMFRIQKQRFFPMPDYDLTDPSRVAVSIRGKIVNENYTQILMNRTDLDLWVVILLDKVQKGLRIDYDDNKKLKQMCLVEGRYPNLTISARVADATGLRVEHIRKRGLERKYYKDMVVELIQQHGPVTRREIDSLLINKLPEVLSIEQRSTLLHNLLTGLRKKGLIRNIGSKRFPQWDFVER